jgi:uncharacterized protein (DUF1015 family)
MPEIQAFRGIRYDLGHVGSLSDVIAPPYDVIDTALQDQLYKKHPANVIRLILNRDEPGDDESNNRYTRAAKFLKNWRSEGVLQRDSDPAIYVYHQSFQFGGQTFNRRGFMARVRLQRFGEGNIYPHEETHASAKADRLKLWGACKSNLSQIFALYPDEPNEAQQLLEAACQGQTPLEATDHLGIVHRMWLVTDVKTISDVAGIMGPKPLYIADGHHRYETACNLRDEIVAGAEDPRRARALGALPDSHPANFVLTQCVSMSDPGMIVLPTHRLFRGLAAMKQSELTAKLGDLFECRAAGEGPEQAAAVWEEIEVEGEQGMLGFCTAVDNRWTLARITAAGQERMAQLAADHSRQWQELGVAILHRLVLENLLGATGLPKPMYVHSVDEVAEGLRSGDRVGRDATGQMGQGGRFALAALVMPASVDHVQAISEHGERMPAKSTYFFPKLLSGLVINPLE